MQVNFQSGFHAVDINRSGMLHCQAKMDKKEKIVRKELVKVWTRLLEEFARPGAVLPSMDKVRKVLENEGVYAATEALNKECWYISRSKIEKEIRKNVKRGLQNRELDAFIDEVKKAQKDPSLLPGLRNHISNYIMGGF